ncbi:anti-sigma factor domain-containing protein [Microlunatus speluncae]|uniref:anti-sigma factor n=1 Tax=Microlunatus speluncae TaxID=2594267 RepID=UPI0012664DDF|nr:anti-sigma factor [Microlunatus speluncae]
MNDIHGYVGAYVADALDDQLRIVFGEHLESCESCSREVTEFAETLAQLSVVAAARPPASVRDDVLAAITKTRIDPPEDDEPESFAPPETLRSDVLAAIARTSTDPDPLSIAGAGSADVRHRRSSRWLALAVAASVIVGLILGGWAVVQHRQIGQLEQATRIQQSTSELLRAPDLRYRPVEFPDGSRGTFLISRAQDRALLTGTIGAAGPARDYQLWTMREGRAVPGPIFHGGAAEDIWIDQLAGADALALTVEAAGGADEPTTDPFGVAEL